jgi:cell division protease FtsH
VTQTLPTEDTLNLTRSKAENTIAFLFGGRAAEEIIFKDFTTGAGNDIERATALARSMVCEWGMSDRIGPLALEKREGPVFLGMQSTQHREYSDSKAQEVDAEVKRLVLGGHDRAIEIINSNITALHGIAKALLEHETIDGEEVDLLIGGSSLEEITSRRAVAKSKLVEEQKQAAQAIEDEKRKQTAAAGSGGSRDPMGNPGPVTA